MKSEEVQNLNLAKYLERNPEATLQDVIDYCKREVEGQLEEFIEIDHKKNAEEMQIMLNSRYIETIYDDICYRNGMRNHQEIAEDAINNYNVTKRQIEEMISNHAKEVLGKIKVVFENELDKLSGEKSNNIAQVPTKIGENERKEIDSTDKGRITFFERIVADDKATILKNFAYIDRTPERIQNLEKDLKRYSGIYGVPPEQLQKVLNDQTGRIFNEFDSLCNKYMKMIEEAVHQLAKEEKQEESEKRYYDDEVLKADTDYKPRHQKKEPEKSYFDEELVEEATVEEPKSLEPEDAKDAKRIISPELAGLATTLENFKTLVMMEINEGLDLKAALDKVQELMLLEEQKKLEEKKSAEKLEAERHDPGKSGLEDVMEDPEIKESDVTKALQEITRDGKEDKIKEESEIQENPFL